MFFFILKLEYILLWLFSCSLCLCLCVSLHNIPSPPLAYTQDSTQDILVSGEIREHIVALYPSDTVLPPVFDALPYTAPISLKENLTPSLIRCVFNDGLLRV